MPQKKIVFVTLDILPQLAPLAGGYLQAYACKDPEIKDTWHFEQFVSTRAALTPARLIAAMERADADLYCFSCYAWNMGLVKAVLPNLLKTKPHATILLGGPQVMNCASRYLRKEHENLLLCNGEGEKTFRNCLLELNKPTPDFSGVKGLSFYRDGHLLTTEAEPRIVDLDEIPSPILAGIFDPAVYSNMVLETNRGCPFTCNYCYWGGAIGSKVHKFSTERIMDELTWIAKNKVFSVAIVDANWGILRRDVDLSRHLVDCKAAYGSPQMVGFSASKNTPDRVIEITKIFHDADLLLNHTISLQTTESAVLERVGRQNISSAAYMEMQRYMNGEGISSHIELIWPLPGETLASFIGGVDTLCKAGADMFFCHPLFLINNIELNNRRAEYGLITIESSDAGSEAEIVVQTKEVNAEEYLDGWRFIFTTIMLHNLRSLYCLPRYLSRKGIETYSGVYRKACQFLREHSQSSFSTLIEESSQLKSVEPITLGRLAYEIYAFRTELDKLLIDFFRSQPWSEDRMAQVFFEVDLLNRPQPYNSAIEQLTLPFGHLDLLGASPDGYHLAIPQDLMEPIANALGVKASFHTQRVSVDHNQGQSLFTSYLPVEACWMQCYQSSFSVAKYAPAWRDLAS
jgi:hypothetical protein